MMLKCYPKFSHKVEKEPDLGWALKTRLGCRWQWPSLVVRATARTASPMVGPPKKGRRCGFLRVQECARRCSELPAIFPLLHMKSLGRPIVMREELSGRRQNSSDSFLREVWNDMFASLFARWIGHLGCKFIAEESCSLLFPFSCSAEAFLTLFIFVSFAPFWLLFIYGSSDSLLSYLSFSFPFYSYIFIFLYLFMHNSKKRELMFLIHLLSVFNQHYLLAKKLLVRFRHKEKAKWTVEKWECRSFRESHGRATKRNCRAGCLHSS